MHNQMELLFPSRKIDCFSNLEEQRLELTAGHEKKKNQQTEMLIILLYTVLCP